MQQPALGVKMHVCIFRLLNAFTPAASPTSRRHISRNTEPNLMILSLLEILGCLVSRESNFIAIGPADQKLWPK